MYQEKLRAGLNDQNYKVEIEKNLLHKQHVMDACLLRKQEKIQRDTQEVSITKKQYLTSTARKKKCRRFKRKEETNDENNNNEIENNIPNSDRISDKVKNISSYTLENDQKKLLELGPKFCPVDFDLDRARLQNDLNKGFRRMRIKEFFFPDEDSRSEEEKRFYIKKSDWESPRTNKTLDVHNMIIQNKFDQWKQPLRIKDNLSVAHREALKNLRTDDRLDIKLDDKSGSFVVANREDYIEAGKHSGNKCGFCGKSFERNRT